MIEIRQAKNDLLDDVLFDPLGHYARPSLLLTCSIFMRLPRKPLRVLDERRGDFSLIKIATDNNNVCE